jgi:DNA-binding LacI/PurR family transcriptional regulator
VYRTNDTADGARLALDALLGADPDLTAVLCFSDVMAAGVVSAATDRGLVVPADLSVVGFDDTPFAAHLRPALTTVHQDVLEKGRLAARAVIGLLHDPAGTEAEQIVLPTELVIRDSTASAREV